MIWLKAGHVALRAANGKFVSAAATGHMRAISDLVTDLEVFRLSLVNRPILVLKCEYGLVGYKNKTNFKLECNKSTFNVIMLEESNDLNGFYYLKGVLLEEVEQYLEKIITLICNQFKKVHMDFIGTLALTILSAQTVLYRANSVSNCCQTIECSSRDQMVVI